MRSAIRALLALTIAGLPGDLAGTQAQDAESESAAFAALAEASRPGADHKALDPLAGRWTMELNYQGLDRTSRRVQGATENRWILGGRVLRCEGRWSDGKTEVEAVAYYGYSRTERQYFLLSMDNLRTSFLHLSGNYSESDRSFAFNGKARGEIAGVMLTYRQLLRIEGPDRLVQQLFVDVPGRGPVKILETIYTR